MIRLYFDTGERMDMEHMPADQTCRLLNQLFAPGPVMAEITGRKGDTNLRHVVAVDLKADNG